MMCLLATAPWAGAWEGIKTTGAIEMMRATYRLQFAANRRRRRFAIAAIRMNTGNPIVQLEPMNALTFRHLQASNARDLQEFQAVFRQTPSFTYTTKGRVPTDTDADRLMKLVPSGCTEDDKQMLAIYSLGELVGCAVFVFSYPNEKVTFIALLVIIESFQGRSLGVEVLRNIEVIAASAGHDRLELVVDSANERAYAFWVREGFTEQFRKASSEFVGDVIVMERSVSSPQSIVPVKADQTESNMK